MTRRIVEAVLERLCTSQIALEQAHESLYALISGLYPGFFRGAKEKALSDQLSGLLEARVTGTRHAHDVARQIALIMDLAAARDPQLTTVLGIYR